jgi:hypothetical protein
MRSPDRVALVADYLPVLAGQGPTLLWVGVRRYTRSYPGILEARGAVCWTTDIDPRWERWGRAGRHITGDITTADQDFDPQTFQAILLNGVFGFGVDDPALQTTALEAMSKVLAPGGWLLIGWNTDRTADPLALPALQRLFTPQGLDGLPARRIIPGTTHIYDLVRRR